MSKKDLLTPETEVNEKPSKESNRSKLFSSLLSEDEEKRLEVGQLSDLLRALSIDGKWFRQQIGLICFIVAGVIVYITNRYQAQQEMLEEDRLHKELLDWKYRSITRSSELTFRTRQTNVMDMLHERGDSTLLPGKTAPYILAK
jgi:hypothetical protein